MANANTSTPSDDDRVGLCATCVHVQRVVTSKGSTFYLCRLSETDDRFPRYPVLPVRICAGYEPPAPPFDSSRRAPSE